VKRFVRDYLTFNKRERNGIIVLLSIILLQILYLQIAPLFYQNKTIDFSEFDKDVKKIEQQQAQSILDSGSFDSEKLSKNIQPHYFKFNPNDMTEDDWKRLGLSEKQIQVIKNYQVKGGKFYSKNDFKKLYCISEKQYLQLQDYIVIPENKSVRNTLKSNDLPVQKIKLVELNSADSLQLVSMKGIGSFYAKAILKYRKQLGGFYSKKQLLEVYNFSEDRLNQIQDYISIDSVQIQKININTCNAKQLKHPYLSWNQVNTIINYRNKHGSFKFVEHIKNTGVIDDSTYSKIASYLTTQ
jgi:competence protein ComEA